MHLVLTEGNVSLCVTHSVCGPVARPLICLHCFVADLGQSDISSFIAKDLFRNLTLYFIYYTNYAPCRVRIIRTYKCAAVVSVL